MRNVLATILTIALVTTGTLVALDLATLVASGPAVPALAQQNEVTPDNAGVIAAFYEAANGILAGNNSTALAAVVSPDVETHAGADMVEHGLDPLVARLASWQERGEVRLTLVRLLGGDDVAALVEAHRPPQPGAGEPRGAARPLWRTTDLFQIEAGMIAAWWPGPIELLPPPPLATAAIETGLSDLGMSLTRLELGPGTTIDRFPSPSHHLIIVENGTLAVSRHDGFAIARAGAAAFTEAPRAPNEDDLVLSAGDAVLLPEQAAPRVRNPGHTPATLHSVLLAPRFVLFDLKHALPKDALTVSGMHDPWRIGRRITWPEGATSETLAVSLFPESSGAFGTVAIGGLLASLQPGEHLPALSAGSLRFLVAQSGTFSIAGLDAVPAYEPLSPPVMLPSASRLLTAGQAITIEAGEDPIIENLGARTADLLVIEAVVTEELSGGAADARLRCSQRPSQTLQSGPRSSVDYASLRAEQMYPDVDGQAASCPGDAGLAASNRFWPASDSK